MATFQQTWDTILFTCAENAIDEESCILLCHLNTSKDIDLLNWNYVPFDFDEHMDDECKIEFRILKNDIHLFSETLNIPEETFCYSVEILSKLLKMFAYLCCHIDIMYTFHH